MTTSSGQHSVQALGVDNIESGLRYYATVLGFRPVTPVTPTGDRQQEIMLRGYGNTLRLVTVPRSAPRRGPASMQERTREPDAAMFVARPGAVMRSMNLRGALVFETGETSGPPEYFVFDRWRNTIAIRPRSGLRPAIARAARPLDGLHERLECVRINRRARQEELPEARRFREFYDNLSARQDIFYSFFSSGMLHWVAKSASLVPDHVNHVLIGTQLTGPECEWVRQNIQRPFHHVGIRVDDRFVWEQMFEVGQQNFGWLDIDCFVFEPGLFKEMTDLAPAEAVASTWWLPTKPAFSPANTYFAFYNAQVLRQVRKALPGIGPGIYSWQPVPRMVPGRMALSRVPDRRLRRRLALALPVDDSGRAIPPTLPPSGIPMFDTTYAYQAVAKSLGYSAKRVRDLRGVPVEGATSGCEISNDCMHVGGVAEWEITPRRMQHASGTDRFGRMSILSYLLLTTMAEPLPGAYQQKLRRVTRDLAQLGLRSDGEIVDRARQILGQVEDVPMTESTISAIIGR